MVSDAESREKRLAWRDANGLSGTAGHLRDAESGNDYAGARYYSSARGRWLGVDPVLGDLANPQRLNRYAYVLNNPINYLDPDGRGEEPFDTGFRIVVSSGVLYATMYVQAFSHSLFGVPQRPGKAALEALEIMGELGGILGGQRGEDSRHLRDVLRVADGLIAEEGCRNFLERIFKLSKVPSAQHNGVSHLQDTLRNASYHYVKGRGAVSSTGTDVWQYFEDNPSSLAFYEMYSGTGDVWVHFRRAVLLQPHVTVAQILIHEAFHLLWSPAGTQDVFGFGLTDVEIANGLGVYSASDPKEASRVWHAELVRYCN